MADHHHNAVPGDMPSQERALRRHWRGVLPFYLFFVLGFPLAMLWVEWRPLHGPTLCLFRQVTHLDCPGCGMTRAFRAMGRLDVVSAFRYNPLGPALFTTVMLSWCIALVQCITGGAFHSPGWWLRRRKHLFYAGLAVYLLVGISRTLYELRYPPPPPTPLHLDIRFRQASGKRI